jgi:hypothetical protein
MVWAVLGPKQNAALKELIDGQLSDRVVGIVGGAMLDDALRTVLEHRLRETSNRSLFMVNGALGNTGPKIDLAYRLYVFEKPMRETMHGISEIRNQMAHNLETSFEASEPKLLQAFEKLRSHKLVRHYPIPGDEATFPLEPTRDHREIFFVNLKLALIQLMADMSKHLPWTNVPNV